MRCWDPPSRWRPEDKHIPISRELVDAGYQELALAHRGLYTPAGATYEEIRDLALNIATTDSFGSGLIKSTPAAGRANIDPGDIFHIERYIVIYRYDCVFNVFRRLDVTKTTHKVFCQVDFDRLSTDINIALPYRFHHLV